MPDPVETDPVPEARTFSQEDVTHASIRASKEAERRATRAAEADFATKLGVDIEEAARIIEAAKAADEANTSEVDKAKTAQAAAEQAAAKAVADAATVTARSAAKDALRDAEVPAKYVADAIKLIDVHAEDLDAEIAALAERMPALFTVIEAGAPKPPPDQYQPPKPPNGSGGAGKSFEDKGREALAAAGIRIPTNAA